MPSPRDGVTISPCAARALLASGDQLAVIARGVADAFARRGYLPREADSINAHADHWLLAADALRRALPDLEVGEVVGPPDWSALADAAPGAEEAAPLVPSNIGVYMGSE